MLCNFFVQFTFLDISAMSVNWYCLIGMSEYQTDSSSCLLRAGFVHLHLLKRLVAFGCVLEMKFYGALIPCTSPSDFQMRRCHLANTVVSNHFCSIKILLFSSARSRDFDGLIGIELPVSMYTTKTPIDLCRFNVRSST